MTKNKKKSECPLRVHPYSKKDAIPICKGLLCGHVLLPDEKICPCCQPQQPTQKDWEEIAKLFHDTYEGLAPYHGYTTRTETRQFNPKSINGKLMIAVCERVVSQILTEQREEIVGMLEGMAVPIGSEGFEKKAYDQALTEAIEKIKRLG